ncbi:MAG: two-component system OmpR family response regulator [Pseudomonadales bacterium]|jgi:two-component system OmpR family response regulator
MTHQGSNTRPTVLILEDNRAILEVFEETLIDAGFVTSSAENIHEFENLSGHHIIDLFLLDLNLPDGNGLTLAKEIRAESDVSIIIVSAKISEIDRVVGLELGADDYITKPFSTRELLARMQSVLRRTHGSAWPRAASDSGEGRAEFLDWTLVFRSRHLRLQDGTGIELTIAEFDLLKAFVESPNRALSRDFLLDQLHGLDWTGYDRGIDGLVSRLGRKIQQPFQPEPLIKTVRSVGYMFTASVKSR